MGLLIRTENSPLMNEYVSPFGRFFAWQAFGVHRNSILVGPRIITERPHQTGKVERSWHFENEIAKTSLSSQLPMWGLIIINLSVYFLWQTQERHSMIRNWLVSVDSVLRGTLHTMLTYSISNNRLDHLMEDMLGLYFFGGEIARKFGGSYMLRVYLVGAIAVSVGHIAYCTLLVPWLEGAPYDDFNYTMTPYVLVCHLELDISEGDTLILVIATALVHGASAATNTLVVILLFPHHIILANYVLPVPGIVFGAYLVLADIYDMYEEGTRTTHAGAVAGALSKVRLWWRIKRDRKRG